MRRVVPPGRLEPGSIVAEVNDLYVDLGGTEILAGITLPVRTGELLALVGPNGAGKSTLLSAICGDTAARSGQVRLYGRELARWSATEMAMRRAMLLQQQTISFPFTVAQLVAMGRTPWAGTPLEDDDETVVAAAMDEVGVTRFADRVFGSLSGGERARVALARVLAQQCQLVLLDEPTAALDLRHQEEVLRLVRERADAGDAVVAVLHDLNLAAAYADRVAVLSAGRLAGDDDPRTILTAELLGDVYRQPVEVWPHPSTGEPVILPRR